MTPSVLEPAGAERLFLALMLGQELGLRVESLVRDALGARAGSGGRSVRLYGARDLHMTVFFLGAVGGERRAALETSLARDLEGLTAPELWLGPTGAFPDARAPRILWIGVRETSPGPLEALLEATRACCSGQGFVADPRPFAAHATVARIGVAGRGPARGRKPMPGVPAEFFGLNPGLAWKPLALALVRSLPGGGAGAYRIEREFTLAGAGK